MHKIIFTIFILLAQSAVSGSTPCEDRGQKLLKAVENEDLGAVRSLLSVSKTLDLKHVGLFAASKGSLEILQELFRYDPELLWGDGVEIKDSSGDTAIMLAVKAGSLDTVRFLIEKDANYETPNSRNQSPLIAAIIEQKFDIAIELLENAAGIEFSQTPPKSVRFHSYRGLGLRTLAWHFSTLWEDRVLEFLKDLGNNNQSALDRVYRRICNGFHPHHDRREVRRLLLKYHPDKTRHKTSIKFQKIMSVLNFV